MQLLPTLVTLSFLSLEVFGRHNRVIKRLPGSRHPGSGLGGGGHFAPPPPEPSGTPVVSLSASTTMSFSLLVPKTTQTTLVGSSASTTSSSSAPVSMQSSLSSVYVSLHNSFRKQYIASPLVWSSTLAAAAQQWASNCQWGHSKMSYGENIAAGTGGNFTAEDAFNMWASETRECSLLQAGLSHDISLEQRNTIQAILSLLTLRK